MARTQGGLRRAGWRHRVYVLRQTVIMAVAYVVVWRTVATTVTYVAVVAASLVVTHVPFLRVADVVHPVAGRHEGCRHRSGPRGNVLP